MSDDPKDVDGKSQWAPGELADGSISVMTPEEARAAIIQRDADEASIDRLLDGDGEEEDLDDISDLDDEGDDD